jgi:predicted AlkP superfamily pyrophosphatase or phosphodiesterase
MLDAAAGFGFSARFDGPVVRERATDRGTHGHLPTRPGMEAAFIATGAEIVPGKNLGRIKLTDITPTLARLLGVEFDELAGEAQPLNLS